MIRRLTLVQNWRRVLRRAWSIRLAAVAGVLTAIEAILPMFVADLPRGLFAALSAVVIVAAMIARIVAQREALHDPET